ncbi:MAG: hypothetical protein LRY55_08925 [Leadbetterella sp.]|nr:hypothetical protein [Leadbetterella sp.]
MRYETGRSYKKLTRNEKSIADSLLAYGLDHEALFTLMDTLKPVSSLKMYRFPLLSSSVSRKDSALIQFREIQKIARDLSNKEIEFVVNPYRRTDSIYKNVQLYAVRKSRLKSVIRQHRDFYARLGITEHSPAETVLSITEYESAYDRWRSYGYLFGYPDYAVDFFVEAGKSEDSTKQFVKRDFFAIPVYARETGYFTYAIPKGHTPGAIDSLIRHKAGYTLAAYKTQRQKYFRPSGFRAVKLWQKSL